MKRRYLSASEKARVMARQLDICACGCLELLVVGQIDFDHVLDLQFGGTNDLSNFCALIRKHHLAKSSANNTLRAKADRAGAKHRGEWLNAKDRELASIRSRTKQLTPIKSP